MVPAAIIYGDVRVERIAARIDDELIAGIDRKAKAI